MSVSFTKKTLAEVLLLLIGAVIAAGGKEYGSPLMLGIGVIVIGVGVLWGGVGAIRRRRLVFLHSEARFTTHRYSGAAAVLWGILLLLAGCALIAGGVGIALGQQAALRAWVMQPGAWLLAGGVALFFASAAALVQQGRESAHGGLCIVLALPGYVFLALGVILGVGLVALGAWGLSDPVALRELGIELRVAADGWLNKL